MSSPMSSSHSKIRLLYIIGQLGLGGSERQLYLLLKHLDKSRFEPHVVVFNPSPYVVLDDDLRTLGVRVYTVPLGCKGILARSWFLYRLFREISPHVVHSWTVHDNPYAGLIGALAGVRLRWGSVRGSIHGRGFASLPALFRWMSLRSVSKLTVNSRFLQDELRAAGISSRRIALIQNCVDCDSSVAFPLSSLSIDEHCRVVGTVGNLRRMKNHDMFIDGMAKVLSDNQRDVRGVIVGQPIPDEAELPDLLTSRIRQRDLDGRVVLAGFQPNVPGLMRELTVFCLTSNSEGFPNVILEAMAAARPVVATRVGGVPELVRDGVTGFLIEPGDVDGFARAVGALLDDPALAERMGRAGRETVERQYSCEIAVQRLSKLYLEALGRQSLPGA